MIRPLAACTAALATALASPPAGAQEPTTSDDVARTEAISLGSVGDVRGKAKDWMIMPGGMYTLSGGLTFLTAPESPFGGGEVRFTDVVLSSFEARYSIGGRGEISGAIEILPKQPAATDESLWQRAQLGARVGFGDRYAGWLELTGGPLFAGDGMWGSGSLGIEAQKSLHQTLVLQGSFGASITSLFEEDESTRSAWFAEAVAGGQMIFRVPNGMMSGWIGTSFHFPVADRVDAAGLELDPQTRANVTLGTALSYIESWDIWFQVTRLDRGEMSAPGTTLPILTTGFDQTQILFGLTRRFREKRDRAPMVLVY